MDKPNLSQPFVLALTGCQNSLQAYITTLVLDPVLAEDILQDTNAALCQQASKFPEINDFTAWACRTAYFQILTHRQRRRRDRHQFDTELLGLIAQEAVVYVAEVGSRQRALRECLAHLPPGQRDLILKRYADSKSLERLAEETGRPLGSLYQTLHRIRRALGQCIQRKMRGSLNS